MDYSKVESVHAMIRRAVSEGERVYLWGPPGTSKTRTLWDGLAAYHGGADPAYVLGHAMLGAEDVLGCWGLKGGSTEWIDGPAARAYRTGAPLIVDEAPRAAGSPAADALLAVTSLSDTARLSLPTGEVLRQPEGWTCAAAGNAGPGSLDDAFRDRFPCAVYIPGPSIAALQQIRDAGLRAVIAGVYARTEPGGEPEVTYRQALAYTRRTLAGWSTVEAATLVWGPSGLAVLGSLGFVPEGK